MMHKNKLIRALLLAVGCVALAVGVVGIFVPLLPTVPLLLLASVCFVRSSSRLHGWLMNHRRLGPPLRSYLLHRAVSRADRLRALAFLWLSLGISIALINHLHVRLLLGVVGLAVSVHLLLLKTLPRESPPEDTPAGQAKSSDDYSP